MPDVDRIRIYRYCPRCAAEAMTVPSPQLVICGACGLRLYYNPCAASGVFLVDPHDRVLLVRRARDPARGKLAVPGGFIDNGESAEDGVRRELREETGIEVGELEFLCSQPNTYPYAGIIYPTLDFYFIARVPELSTARALDDVAEVVIRAPAEFHEDELAFVSMKAAWRVFRERIRR